MTTPDFEIEFQFQITHSLRFVKSLIALKSRLRNCHCDGTPCLPAGREAISLQDEIAADLAGARND